MKNINDIYWSVIPVCVKSEEPAFAIGQLYGDGDGMVMAAVFGDRLLAEELCKRLNMINAIRKSNTEHKDCVESEVAFTLWIESQRFKINVEYSLVDMLRQAWVQAWHSATNKPVFQAEYQELRNTGAAILMLRSKLISIILEDPKRESEVGTVKALEEALDKALWHKLLARQHQKIWCERHGIHPASERTTHCPGCLSERIFELERQPKKEEDT